MITWMQKHRKYLVPTIWISTIAFVGAGFVGWGAYDYGNKSNTIAQVGEKAITMNELQHTYSNLYGYYNQLFGGKLTQEKAKEMGLQEVALQKLTNEALLLNYANELGITALDSEVIEEYKNIKAFQKNGLFSKTLYEQVLRAQGLDKKLFEKELEKSIILKKLRTILNMPATPLETKALFAASSLADHLIVKKITQSVNDVSVSEEELKKAWENHKGDYMSATTYILETIKVPSSEINVSEEAIEAFYDEKKYKFKDSDGKILPLEKAKEAVKKAVQQKKAKKAVLKKYLAFKKGEITAQKELTVDNTTTLFPFSLLKDKKRGAYLKAVALEDGYMTARIKEIQLPQPLSFEKARAMVEIKVRQEKAQSLLKGRAKTATKTLTDGKDLGFVSIRDTAKITDVNPQVASAFLRYVFSKEDKSGYFISGDSALVYHIKEQRLFDQDNLAKEQEKSAKSVATLKENSLENGLINKLKTKYKIERFIKEG